MESTWEPRDLPVLDAIVAAFDDPTRRHMFTHETAALTGMDQATVVKAVRALDGRYLVTRQSSGDDELEAITVVGVTDAARHAVGQWPSPDAWADRIVQALLEAAEQEPDEAKKSGLRTAADALGGFGRDVLVGVMSGGITQAMRG